MNDNQYENPFVLAVTFTKIMDRCAGHIEEREGQINILDSFHSALKNANEQLNTVLKPKLEKTYLSNIKIPKQTRTQTIDTIDALEKYVDKKIGNIEQLLNLVSIKTNNHRVRAKKVKLDEIRKSWEDLSRDCKNLRDQVQALDNTDSCKKLQKRLEVLDKPMRSFSERLNCIEKETLIIARLQVAKFMVAVKEMNFKDKKIFNDSNELTKLLFRDPYPQNADDEV